MQRLVVELRSLLLPRTLTLSIQHLRLRTRMHRTQHTHHGNNKNPSPHSIAPERSTSQDRGEMPSRP